MTLLFRATFWAQGCLFCTCVSYLVWFCTFQTVIFETRLFSIRCTWSSLVMKCTGSDQWRDLENIANCHLHHPLFCSWMNLCLGQLQGYVWPFCAVMSVSLILSCPLPIWYDVCPLKSSAAFCGYVSVPNDLISRAIDYTAPLYGLLPVFPSC